MKSMIDLGQDGEINIIDITLWILGSLFTLLSCLLLILGGQECYFALLRSTANETHGNHFVKLIKYIVTLTQIFGTFGTLIYSIAFLKNPKDVRGNETTEGSHESSPPQQQTTSANSNGFFDFDKDGKIGLIDLLCTATGTIHSILIFLNGLLWYLGYLTPSDIVDFVAANTRVIILILTQSYFAIHRDPTKYSRWRFYVDVNHDGVVELVDVFAVIFNTSYLIAMTSSFYIFMMAPIGQADLGGFIQLTSQLNFVLISAFASVYLSKKMISVTRRRILEFVSLCFLALLARTLVEILISDELFKGVSKLLNGLVLGVTQLLLGIFMTQTQTNVNGKQL
jgi:hypothetical protein